MKTNWDLIRKTMNAATDACEEIEKMNIADCESGNGEIRHTDVSVGDFLDRFAGYPQGSARGIIRLRASMGKNQNSYGPLAKALINNATACAEVIGLGDADLKREVDGHVPHCGTAGKSVEEHLTAIGGIYSGWMIPDMRKALDAWRSKHEYECKTGECGHEPLCHVYQEMDESHNKTDAADS